MIINNNDNKYYNFNRLPLTLDVYSFNFVHLGQLKYSK